MLVGVAVTGLDPDEVRQGSIVGVLGELPDRSDVGYVYAEIVIWIPDRRPRSLRGRVTCGLAGIGIDVCLRVAKIGESSRGHLAQSDTGATRIIACVAVVIGCTVINLPRHAPSVQCLKDGRDKELRQVIVSARIPNQPFGRASGQGSDAIRNTFAGNWREPAIGKSELRSHVVVVVQVHAVVVTHRALAGQIGELPASTATGRVSAELRVPFRRMHEAVHIDGPGRTEIVTIDHTVTRQPRRRVVVDAGALQLEQGKYLTLVINVSDGAEFVVDAIYIVSKSIIPNVPPLLPTVRIEHAEVMI